MSCYAKPPLPRERRGIEKLLRRRHRVMRCGESRPRGAVTSKHFRCCLNCSQQCPVRDEREDGLTAERTGESREMLSEGDRANISGESSGTLYQTRMWALNDTSSINISAHQDLPSK